jgi:hypothetical protein
MQGVHIQERVLRDTNKCNITSILSCFLPTIEVKIVCYVIVRGMYEYFSVTFMKLLLSQINISSRQKFSPV